MGLLDDAIREHLDLKRRRGADPAEVERAEREALGPVRRAPEGQPSPDLESESGIAYDHEADDEESWSHDSADESPPVTAEPNAPAEPREYEQPLGHDEPEFEPEPDLTVGDDERPSTPPPHPAGGHETAEYDVEEALGAEHEPGDDDVLEETPEFLQDTPDHDRLWFEQRPPKDFDFDG
jgi:hypothetical protein